jgi:hypothetical protein
MPGACVIWIDLERRLQPAGPLLAQAEVGQDAGDFDAEVCIARLADGLTREVRQPTVGIGELLCLHEVA